MVLIYIFLFNFLILHLEGQGLCCSIFFRMTTNNEKIFKKFVRHSLLYTLSIPSVALDQLVPTQFYSRTGFVGST